MPGGIHPPVGQWLIWPAPNYINPPTKPKYVLFFACLLGPISIAAVLARLWIRIRIQKNSGWDDWLMLASLFPVMTLTIILPLVTEHYYFNRHSWDIEFKYFPIQRRYVIAIYALFSLASGLIKMSVLLFYRRLSSRAVSPAFRWTLRITIGAIGIYTVIFIFVTIFMCSPVSAFWNQEDFLLISKGGYKYKCLNEGAEIVANGVLSTVQDFIAASLPALLCWKLQMHARQKVALYSVFAVSYIVVAIGALRTYSSYRLFYETYDVTWAAGDVWLWSLLEMHIGSMCANTPALKAFYTHYCKQKPQRRTTSNPIGSNTLWSRLTSWKLPSSNSSKGYLSESHTSKQGAIVQTTASTVQGDDDKRLAATPEYVDTVFERNGRGNDIEMGQVQRLTHMSVMSNVQALPPIIPPPQPARTWKIWGNKP